MALWSSDYELDEQAVAAMDGYDLADKLKAASKAAREHRDKADLAEGITDLLAREMGRRMQAKGLRYVTDYDGDVFYAAEGVAVPVASGAVRDLTTPSPISLDAPRPIAPTEEFPPPDAEDLDAAADRILGIGDEQIVEAPAFALKQDVTHPEQAPHVAPIGRGVAEAMRDGAA